MTEPVDLDAVAQRSDDARARLVAARKSGSHLVDDHRRLRARGETPPADLDVAAREARDAIEEALRAALLAERAHMAAFVSLVAAGEFHKGDRVRSPKWPRPLVVAEMLRDDETVSEVTLTADGFPARRTRHSWALDRESHTPRIDVPDQHWVRFERWSRSGLRVAGSLHPTSRRVTAID